MVQIVTSILSLIWVSFYLPNSREGPASPSLLTRSWWSTHAPHTPSPWSPITLSCGDPWEPWPMNKGSMLTGVRKRAKNLQNHQLNPRRAALVCQHRDVMSQSSLQHQDPTGDGPQNIPYSLKPTFMVQLHQTDISCPTVWPSRNHTFLWIDPEAW